MQRSRTMTAPTCLRSQVARVATSRAMFMKYSSQEARCLSLTPRPWQCPSRAAREGMARPSDMFESCMSYRDDQAALRQRIEGLCAERAAIARQLAPVAELRERADRLSLELEQLCARASRQL